MTTTQWPGDTAKRELRRAQLVGTVYVSRLYAGKHDPALHERIRKETRLRDRWIWAEKHLETRGEGLDLLRAEIAGSLIVQEIGASKQQSLDWFEAAAALDDWAEGWYFDHECLPEDGWIRGRNGQWTKTG